MNTHFTFQDRVKLQYSLDNNYDLSASMLSKALNKARSSIYYEIRTNMLVTKGRDIFNTASNFTCVKLSKFPFVCNGCPNIRCSHRKYFYDAYIADSKAKSLLSKSRSDTALKRRNIRIINSNICPLVNKGQSIYVAKKVSCCELSESTIRRYINNDLVITKRHDLPKSIRFKAKKEYNYSFSHNIDINILNGRTYEDFKEFIKRNKGARVIQLDSIVGKRNDTKAILTVYFVSCKLQLGFLYDRKHPRTPEKLKSLLKLGRRHKVNLFDVALADNGSEFKSLYKLEVDDDTGEILCKTFYTDPYRSCQKAECERNHGLFRRVIPKGRSFNTLTQEELDDIFSHINSYPRSSLNGKTPFELFSTEYNSIILSELNIHQINNTKVNLKLR